MSAWWLPVAILWPLALASLLALPRLRPAAVALAPWASAPALAAVVWVGAEPVQAPALLLGLRFELDATGRSFLLLAALLWLAAGLAARAYHATDDRRTSLWAFWLAAQAGNLWLIAAGDAAGFYAGFALMSLAGYGLVIHARTNEAWGAGRVYLTMALAGEAALLAGLLLRVAETGTMTLPLPAAGADATATVLLLAGFGVKAGLLGVHMWLPLAHPVAPTPASAVLSGVMIKAGVLGWLRFLPIGADAWPLAGATAIALGLAGAFGAVAIGLAQRAPKTMLAYSSVSQMGLIAVAVGAALLHPPAAPALVAAIALYALHHGLAKGALFLGVASIPAAGAARRLALAAQALPALALAGAPWTSGALAKDELKVALAALPEPWPQALAWLLPLAAIGSTLLLARVLLAQARGAAVATPGMAPAWLAAVAASVGLGVVVAWPLATAGWLAAAAPVAIGGALAILAASLRPLAPASARAPRVGAGDLLEALAPPLALLWRGLLRLAAAGDRDHDEHDGSHLPAVIPAVPGAARLARAEAALRGMAVFGVALLALLCAAWLALR